MWWFEEKPDEIGPPPSDVKQRLAGLSIFSAADPSDIDHLAAGTQQAHYVAGRKVIREARIPSHLYVVISGDLEVWTTGDEGGDEKKVNTLGPGDHFGEVGLLEGMPSTATVTTVGPVSLLRVPASAFLEVLARSPAIHAALIESVGGAMARSHPAYQLATEAGPPALTPAQVVSQTRELFQSLAGQPRADFILSLKEIVDEEEKTAD